MSAPEGEPKPDDPAAEYKPFVPASTLGMRELTLRGVVIGALLGVVFALASVYLGLKVGLTVSASIPVAVMSITLFRWLGRLPGVGKLFGGSTILENNIVQTTGSAGESLAAGVAFTLPSLLLMGFELELMRIMLVALLGGLIGVLMMIPLRHGLIVKEHGKLIYPEGTACADVLIVGEQGGTNAKAVFFGFFVGFGYAVLNLILKLWGDAATFAIGFWGKLKGATLSFEVSPPMLGVGYIIGFRVAATMMAGGLLAYVILIPLVHQFGDALPTPLYPATALPIAKMSAGQIRNAYILYIGAGAVAMGGFIALAKAIPTIGSAFAGGMRSLRATQAEKGAKKRTERDLPMSVVLGGSLALVAAIWLAPILQINAVSALLILLFGFFFVTVSSRICGEIGSSSNPISGMTVATLLLTCLVFLMVGWTGPSYYVTALSVGAIVCIASANAGATSQDLKTGFLVGATPRSQQIAIMIGAVLSAFVLGPILLTLNDSATVYVPRISKEPAAAGAGQESGQASGETAGQTAREAHDTAMRDVENFSATLRVDPSTLDGRQVYQGRQYLVWHKPSTDDGPAGKYLVDESGSPAFFVDPGINGTHRYTPDGRRQVAKFDAPKATLMSYIIKGILNRQLPWGLVLLGVMIALVLEMSGVPSLAFAVGVYLPLSSSSPIFVGGMVRWLTDRHVREKHRKEHLTEEQLTAEGDKSPGVLMASGYIAGGAIAGILIAFMAGAMADVTDRITQWSTLHNPFFEGARADLWSMLPFTLLVALLYLVGREVLLRPRAGHRP